MNLATDILNFVRSKFSESHQEQVLAALNSATIHDGTQPSNRLLRCVVVASNGDLKIFTSLVELLKIDWRDVIMAGEYQLQDGKTIQVRDLNQPIPPAPNL